MSLFERILVPVDGSRYSRDAVRVAAQLAAVLHARVALLHVLDVSLLEHLSSFSTKDRESVHKQLRTSANGFLQDMEREVAMAAEFPVETLIREGVPHETILEETVQWRADLIIMGKLGRRGVSHILLGSVTERVVEFSEVPVLVVK